MKKDEITIDNAGNKDWDITEVLKELNRKGYKMELRREATCIYCFEWQQWIMPANFTVDESYYLEEMVSPDAERMLYAISLSQGKKGFLIDTCNVYVDNINQEMMEKLKLNKIISGNDLKILQGRSGLNN